MSAASVGGGQGVAVVTMAERRLDAANAGAFREMVGARITAGEVRLVLDMSKVEFIDSSGLGALVGVFKRVGPRGELAIAGTRPAVEKAFKLTRMDRVFKIYPDVASAVAGLGD